MVQPLHCLSQQKQTDDFMPWSGELLLDRYHHYLLFTATLKIVILLFIMIYIIQYSGLLPVAWHDVRWGYSWVNIPKCIQHIFAAFQSPSSSDIQAGMWLNSCSSINYTQDKHSTYSSCWSTTCFEAGSCIMRSLEIDYYKHVSYSTTNEGRPAESH